VSFSGCAVNTVCELITICIYVGSDGINKSDTACDMCNSSETIVVISSSVFAVVFLVLVVLAVLTLMLIRHRKKVSCQEHCS
jgi:heme/copper-type cytochrome/quinol oxidase subunit 2